MITETTAMQTTAIYSDDKTHRYLLRKEWDSEKKSAEIIMLSEFRRYRHGRPHNHVRTA